MYVDKFIHSQKIRKITVVLEMGSNLNFKFHISLFFLGYLRMYEQSWMKGYLKGLAIVW